MKFEEALKLHGKKANSINAEFDIKSNYPDNYVYDAVTNSYVDIEDLTPYHEPIQIPRGRRHSNDRK